MIVANNIIIRITNLVKNNLIKKPNGIVSTNFYYTRPVANSNNTFHNLRNFSNNDKQKQLTSKQKLKRAVAEYGSTVIVFHVTISLISLGVCYVLVSSGVDVDKVSKNLGVSDESKLKTVAANTGTFAISYAIHKMMAPLRIITTLTATPFIVRYLRSVGLLKKR